MKSKYEKSLIGRCESYCCNNFDDSVRCVEEGQLYAVWGQHINLEDAHEYYYCPQAVQIDLTDGWNVQKLEAKDSE